MTLFKFAFFFIPISCLKNVNLSVIVCLYMCESVMMWLMMSVLLLPVTYFCVILSYCLAVYVNLLTVSVLSHVFHSPKLASGIVSNMLLRKLQNPLWKYGRRQHTCPPDLIKKAACIFKLVCFCLSDLFMSFEFCHLSF